ncbi:MAG: acetyltransferase [Campylobacter sp.]|nr:acetyltransferase [Campylobacter sp.]
MAKTEIYIYGDGGHGRVVADIARSLGYEKIIFLDDKSESKFSPNLPKKEIIIAIGDNCVRAKVQDKVLKSGFEVVSLIHPSAIVSKSAVVGKGVVIMPNAVINANVLIKDGAIINTSAVVEHDCVIGEFAHLSPNVAIAGGVKVGEFSHLGIASSVIQKISIGANSTIGAGACVIDDISPDCVAVGVPARVIKTK